MQRRSVLAQTAAAAAIFLASCPAAQAQSAPAWEFEFSPYFWGAAMEGDVGTSEQQKAHIDESFSDILKVLDFGFMGMLEARRGRWSALFDGIYMKLSDGASTPGPLFGNADVKIVQQLYSLAGTYRVLEGRNPVDVLAGLRYNYIRTELDLTAGTLPGARTSDTQHWVDAFVGVRGQYYFNDRWSVLGYGDIGGGGSNLAWQAMSSLRYDFSKTYSAFAGYRYMSVDYDDNGFLYDVDSSGIYAGLNIRF